MVGSLFSHSGGGVGNYPGVGGTFQTQCFSHVSNGGAYQGIAGVGVGYLCLFLSVACQETAGVEVGPLGGGGGGSRFGYFHFFKLFSCCVLLYFISNSVTSSAGMLVTVLLVVGHAKGWHG